MIGIPIFTENQKKEFDALRTMTGWVHLVEPIKRSIELKEAAIINFSFERDKEAKIIPSSIFKYEDIQKDLVLLKEFLYFLENGGIIEENKDYDPFEKAKAI